MPNVGICDIFKMPQSSQQKCISCIELFPHSTSFSLHFSCKLLLKSGLVSCRRVHLHKWISQILMSGDNTKADSIKMCFNQFFNLLLWIALACTRTDRFSGGKTWRSGKHSPKYSLLSRKNTVPTGAKGLCWLMGQWKWAEQKSFRRKQQKESEKGSQNGHMAWASGRSVVPTAAWRPGSAEWPWMSMGKGLCTHLVFRHSGRLTRGCFVLDFCRDRFSLLGLSLING